MDRTLDRDDIRNLLNISIDVIVQCKRVDDRFRVTEVCYAGHAHTATTRQDASLLRHADPADDRNRLTAAP